MRAWILAAPLLTGALPSSPRPTPPTWAARAEDARIAAARRELLAQLDELASWCSKEKIYARRLEVYEWIVHFDPDHAVARRSLGYERTKDGGWKLEKEQRVPPRDWDAGAARAFETRRASISGRFREALIARIEDDAERLPKNEALDALNEMLFLDPDDERAHTLLGEARSGERWVLIETVRGKARRAELVEHAKAAIESAPDPALATPDAKERGLGLAWTAVYTTPIVRALGTGSEKELRRLTDVMWGARAHFRFAIGPGADYPPDFTVYSLAEASDKALFLANHPAIDGEYEEFLARCDGSGIQGTGDLAHWGSSEPQRVDGLVRQAITWLLAERFGILPEHGWAFEGIGLYLTKQLVGTRLTWFVKRSDYLDPPDDLALQARLLDSRTDWMREARKRLGQRKRPRLAFVLGKDVNSLTAEDLLFAYVLAAYLIEAEPAKTPVLLADIGAGTPSVQAFEKHLDRSPDELGEHVIRWLQERD